MNSRTVTCLTIPAKSIAASIPELPPPITATSFPVNNGPSQCGQYATPLFLNSASPGTPTLRQRAPVETITLLLFRIAPFSSSTSISSFFSKRFARCRFITSMSYSFTCSSRLATSLGPSVRFTLMKFSMPIVSIT
ncbi:Uncharacterised protein [Streptococcus pneumoniae]|nr:Uncharacterised protein [Streptococcus pneumoniae]CKF22104.1 Uncharacterised protein [Streptococcus pneumoniae]